MAAGTISCAVVSLAFTFVYPALTPYIIDDVIGNQRGDQLPVVIMVLIGAFFLRELFNSLRIMINNHFEQNVIYDMRREVYQKLQRLPVKYFDQRASGDLMTRVIEDVNAVERLLIDGTEQGTVAILSVVGVIGILFFKNVTLALVTLVTFPLLIGGALIYTLTAHRRYRRQREASSAMNALLMDNLQGIRQIKAFGQQDHEDRRFAERADGLRQGTLDIMKAWALYSPSMAFINSLGTGLILWVGGVQVINGTMTVGELMGFVFFLNLLYDPVSRLHGLNQMMQGARAAGERVFDILDQETERPNRQGTLALPIKGLIRYENVSFQYTEDRETLTNINLTAKPGEMIALVGPTGAGKSSLVNLLPAFYELSGGEITIDGQDTSALSLAALRSVISVVSQESFLFNGTVRENILYGQLDATEEDMVAATRAANCHHFIEALPEGYDAHVGERGVKLSVGEKQRISIARALLKDSPILILDEATASVDTATEKLIQEALEHLMKGRTSFVIAHRLSTIRKADQILVMTKGKIIENGDHESLMKKEGVYAKLARIQNTTFIEESFEKLSL
ncbi:ABC transporter ATP-binding protein/permease [bacterium]|jgi:ATP-binding cassette, subfamily B, bacterial|nr:ABC transporter ATP-binding protein/permease [bacterium]MDA7866488.1 ABC transporter ATP-binding protein/permease [Verrucomicrobiota bacterium]MDB4746031.1 ABC transporter ATP-binding protein/permease [Verrucomicrobiota bacterium]MDB4798655.1 ABC transporter ATP-binding protein/permease [Verrucomicrobiota bacterium]